MAAENPTVEQAQVESGEKPPAVERCGQVVCGALLGVQLLVLAAMLVVVCAEIVARRLLSVSMPYSDDLLTFLLTWLLYLGVPRAVWEDSSPRLRLFGSAGRVTETAQGIQWGTLAVYLVYVCKESIGYLPAEASATSSLGISYLWFGIAVTVSSALGALLLVLTILRTKLHIPHYIAVAVSAAFCFAVVAHALPYPALSIVVAFVLIILGAPIAVALGIGGMSLLQAALVPLSAAPQQLVGATNNVVLISIPLFLLVGALIGTSGLARRFAVFAKAALGWIPGGLGVADVATSAVFANLTGSAVADTAAIGTIFIPELIETGEYTPASAAALQSGAGLVGILFPPAIAMILFATVSNASVIGVFEAALVAGLLLSTAIAVVSVLSVTLTGKARRGQFILGRVIRSAPGALPVLAIPLILDGGILSGIATPAESGAVAVLVTLLWIAIFDGPRQLSPRALLRSARSALDNAVLALFILANVSILDFGFASSGLSDSLVGWLTRYGSNRIIFLLLLNLALLVVHMFIETSPAILVFVPLILPAALKMGIPVYQLAAVVGVNSTIGLMLPPVGVSLFVASGIAKVNPKDVIPHALAYVAGCLVILALVSAIPVLSTWLPSVLS